MKECPACRRCFPDHVNHCPNDGDATVHSIAGEPILDGRYQLERRLGHGGMGVVFQARHIFLKTAHAIKVILPDLVGNDPMLVTRFRQEALAAAAIRHQNIIAVTDFGVARGTMPFLVMEFVKGKSLHDILAAEGPLSPSRALEIMSAVGAGVGAAHRQNIVHRDLKPLNIMLQEDMPVNEAVKVLDFGLAKIKSGELLGSFVQAKTSGLMGSPFYMAPEQWSDEEPDVRADIYSLGVILYQMLGGDVPFKGTGIPSIMKKHLTAAPPTLSSMGVNVPPTIEAVVRHALEKDADNRPQTVEAFITELRDAVAQTSASLDRTYVGGAVSETIITPSQPMISSRPPMAAPETTLLIRTVPPYSRVYINNVSIGKSDGTGELVLEEVQSGTHQVRVVHDGYAEWQRQIECKGGECRVEAQLQSLSQTSMPQMSGDQLAGTITGGMDQMPPASIHSIEAQRLRAQAAALEEKARQEEAARVEHERREQERREMEERDRIAREELAREDEARRLAEEERKRLEAEAHEKAEAEARLLAEADRKQAEAAERQRLEEAERRAEEERKRDEESQRLRAEAAAARKQAEAEAQERRRLEEERARAEAEARQRSEEEKLLRAEEEAARQKAEEAAAQKRAAEEKLLRAEAESARQRADEESIARKRAEEEAARLRAEQETRKKADEENALRRAEEERQRIEEAQRLRAEAEAARKQAQAEAAERKRVEEERKQAEIEAQRRIEEERKAAEAAAQKRIEEERRRAEAERQRLEQERQEREERERAAIAERERLARELKEREEQMARMAATSIAPDINATHQQRRGVDTGQMGEQSLSDATMATSWQQQQSQQQMHQSVAPAYMGAQPKKSSMPMIVIAAVLAVVVIGGGAGAYFMLGSKSAPTDQTKTDQKKTGDGQNSTEPKSTKAEMVAITGGTFQMGRNDGPQQETPAHSVTVSDFSMDKTEVTNTEYAEFVNETKRTPPSHWPEGKVLAGQEQWPVNNVSLDDAKAFAAWRSKRDGVTYRLPTEEEWEYAARNGDQANLYPWGNSWANDSAVVKMVSPQTVGSFQSGKNRWGVLDLIGNVWEWTSSKASVYQGSPLSVPAQDKDSSIIRGGSYASEPGGERTTATTRDWVPASTKHPTLGFRLVRAGS
jgi:serine/threonine protein kinase/formylglycine-generating enzyme required for sulfatase activity